MLGRIKRVISQPFQRVINPRSGAAIAQDLAITHPDVPNNTLTTPTIPHLTRVKRLTRAKNTLEEAKNSHNNIMKDYLGLEAELEQKNIEINQLKTDKEQLQAEIDILEVKLDQLQAEINNSNLRIQQLQSEITTLNEEITALNNENILQKSYYRRVIGLMMSAATLFITKELYNSITPAVTENNIMRLPATLVDNNYFASPITPDINYVNNTCTLLANEELSAYNQIISDQNNEIVFMHEQSYKAEEKLDKINDALTKSHIRLETITDQAIQAESNAKLIFNELVTIEDNSQELVRQLQDEKSKSDELKERLANVTNLYHAESDGNNVNLLGAALATVTGISLVTMYKITKNAAEDKAIAEAKAAAAEAKAIAEIRAAAATAKAVTTIVESKVYTIDTPAGSQFTEILKPETTAKKIYRGNY